MNSVHRTSPLALKESLQCLDFLSSDYIQDKLRNPLVVVKLLSSGTEGEDLGRTSLTSPLLYENAYLARFISSLGEASKSIATKKILFWSLSKKRQAIFMPTPAPNHGVCTLPVTLI